VLGILYNGVALKLPKCLTNVASCFIVARCVVNAGGEAASELLSERPRSSAILHKASKQASKRTNECVSGLLCFMLLSVTLTLTLTLTLMVLMYKHGLACTVAVVGLKDS
jgi:hypothetical protein